MWSSDVGDPVSCLFEVGGGVGMCADMDLEEGPVHVAVRG